MFEYNKESSICEKHVNGYRDGEVYPHYSENISKVLRAEESNQKESESDNGNKFEEGSNVICFKYWEKVLDSSRYTKSYCIDICLFRVSLINAIDYGNEPPFCNGGYYDEKKKKYHQSDNTFYKIVSMYEIYNKAEELIVEVEYVDITPGNLVEENARKIEC